MFIDFHVIIKHQRPRKKLKPININTFCIGENEKFYLKRMFLGLNFFLKKKLIPKNFQSYFSLNLNNYCQKHHIIL